MQYKLLKAKDNAEGQLDSNIGASTLTIVLQTGDGANFPATYRSTTTSLGDAVTLNKTGIGSSGVGVGDFIENITDGSHAYVLAVSTDSLTTTTLRGGSGNIWGNGDTYSVNRFVVTLNKRSAEGVITASEKVLIDSRSGDILTVNASGRGYDGSIAQTFDASDYCNIFVVGLHLTELSKAFGQMEEQITLRYTKSEVDAFVSSLTDAIAAAEANASPPTGSITAFAGAAAPTGWALCDGTSISKTTYKALHLACNFLYGEGAINTKLTQTFTAVAATNVCTSTGHTLNNDVPVVLTSTGTLPAGLSLATVYWIVQIATNTFKLSATRGGAEIDITGAGSGTHTWTQWMKADATTDTLYTEAHGMVADDLVSFSSTGSLPTGITALTNYYVINPTADTFQISTTLGGSALDITAVGTAYGSSYIKNFLVPNLQGRVPVGKDAATFATQGATGGEETHALTTAELASHSHVCNLGAGTSASVGYIGVGQANTTDLSTEAAGSGTAHNNIQPYLTVQYIIKT